jgi:uncharacterized protein involved in copper resistance
VLDTSVDIGSGLAVIQARHERGTASGLLRAAPAGPGATSPAVQHQGRAAMTHEGTPAMEHEATLAMEHGGIPAPWQDATLTGMVDEATPAGMVDE